MNTLVASWQTQQGSSAQDYAAANIGQVKALTAQVYDRLILAGLATSYPWPATTIPENEYALVNAGQLKQLYNFSLPPLAPPGSDSDSDGLPDAWELRWWPDLTTSPSAVNPATGLTHLASYLEGRNPLVAEATNLPGTVGLTVYTSFE